ncbi:ferredoxin reductase family protein [Aequorivita marisscotiae]|uniref:Ferric reductase-like transmembrane domain-containing protein n=1 Tax=Aequorivita marisscotiae TaxID=3040348 RepID=A0ABY8KU85_9FLAO|nr:ferric reductase-like transmembrane domain-containing protein [Aequorivita sp. Ant34-E75]WGF91720.1 ferric reductase-like transmembrane domain-containing protein [Aequorivita sp. Ant34-E75]
MKNRDRYLILIFLVIVLPIFLWGLSFPQTTIKHNAYPIIVYGSQLFAVIGFSLFAFSFMLSTRIKVIEKYFGGLDKLYRIHHTIGKLAFFALLIHPVVLAVRWLPDNIAKTFWYLLPVHRKMEINLSSWALLGLTTLLLFTLVIKLPYDKWKITHKFMGLIFILGIVHVFGVAGFYEEKPLLAIYFIIISILGVSAFMYKAIFHKWAVKKYPFTVVKIDKLDERTMEITLRNESADFDYIPGQFCFFQFVNEGISMESHPFTICGSSKEGEINILVKSLGDYTNNLYKKLTLDSIALVEGPYGCFDYKLGKEKQIWIGGGVGIAPFISWCRDLEKNSMPGLEVELYYCVNSEAEAFHLHEFQKLEKALPNFRVTLSCSDKSGFLKVRDIGDTKNKTIFICGPKEMRSALLKDFKGLKIPKENIIFEDFDFI